MNVTTSFHWTGAPVGISRVEFEISRYLTGNHFYDSGTDLVSLEKSQLLTKIQSDDSESNFAENFPLKIRERAPKIVPPLNRADYFFANQLQSSRKFRLVKGLGLIASIFYGMNPYIDQLFHVLARQGARFYKGGSRIKSLRKPFRKIYGSSMQSNKKTEYFADIQTRLHPFDAGDVIFTAGLDWDSLVIDKLVELKIKTGIKIVSVIQDLIPINNPEYLANKRHADRLLQHFTQLIIHSDLIITGSKTVERDILHFASELGDFSVNTKVINWAPFDTAAMPIPPARVSMDLESHSFLLCVGTFEIRKNYGILLDVINLASASEVKLPKIIIVGRVGWGSNDIYQRIKSEASLKDSIVHLQNVSDGQLAWLYANCKALLSPSFDEGFGLPVVEALAYGKPLVLSDIAIYRELFPGSRFASPYNAGEWLTALRDLESIDHAEIKGVEKRTWQTVTLDILDALKEFNLE